MTRKHLTEEQIQRMIASDPDAPEATDDQIAQARPFADAFPALADAMRKNTGGRPKSTNPKVAVSLRLDQPSRPASGSAAKGIASQDDVSNLTLVTHYRSAIVIT